MKRRDPLGGDDRWTFDEDDDLLTRALKPYIPPLEDDIRDPLGGIPFVFDGELIFDDDDEEGDDEQGKVNLQDHDDDE